jgi:PIN domain nuclease of toxin-antitoxin system
MRLLLDTHTFLWFVLGDSRLSSVALAMILDPGYVKLISPASYWEIAIKISTGKYVLPELYDVFMLREIQQNGFQVLHITVAHTAVVAGLPFHHRDPFDRLLAAQCLAEQLPLVSADGQFDAYGVTRLW